MCVVQECAAGMAMAATSDHSAAQLMLDLSAARHVCLSKSSVALLLKSGQLALAHLTVEAGMVKQMRVSHPPLRHSPEHVPCQHECKGAWLCVTTWGSPV